MVRDIREVVEEYFEERGFNDLMDCGASGDEGLYDISGVVADCLVEVGYPVDFNYAEDGLGDGKYVIHIGCLGTDNVYDLYAWDGVDDVVEIIEDILK